MEEKNVMIPDVSECKGHKKNCTWKEKVISSVYCTLRYTNKYITPMGLYQQSMGNFFLSPQNKIDLDLDSLIALFLIRSPQPSSDQNRGPWKKKK